MGPPPGPSLVTGLPSCFTLQELDYWCYCEGLLAAHTQGWEQDPDPESYTIQLCICPFVWCKQNAPRCPGSVALRQYLHPKAIEFVLSCMNFDGGFGCRPGSESHNGQDSWP